MTYSTILPIIGCTWFIIGVGLGLFMRRRGHLGYGWFVIGVLMGPMALVFAIDTLRHDPPVPPNVATRRSAPSASVDVLVGVDGSPASAAAIDSAVALLGPTLGRLTLATVIDLDTPPDSPAERAARGSLEHWADRIPQAAPELVVLRGSPAKSLVTLATGGEYDLLVVGARGKGLSKRVLGSVARVLSSGCPVPVLVGTPEARRSPQAPAAPRLDRVSA